MDRIIELWWCREDSKYRTTAPTLGELLTPPGECEQFKDGVCMVDGKPCGSTHGKITWDKESIDGQARTST